MGDAPCILRHLDRDADVGMDDDLCEGRIGPLVRLVDLAQSYRSKRAGIPAVARDARYAESGAVRACLVTCGCGAQTSFLEQGRRADADAIFRSFREMTCAVGHLAAGAAVR